MTGETEPEGQLRQYVGGLLCRRVIRIKSRQVLTYRGQVAGTYQILRLPAGNQSVTHRLKLAVHTLSQLQSGGLRTSSTPVTAPVNINHYLLSPRVLAADVGRGAAITVTVTG